MAEIDFAKLCVPVLQSSQSCVTFPGGFTVCAQVGLDLGDPAATARALFGQLNTGLAPLVPFFNVLDVLIKLYGCVQAIPDAISSLNPTKIGECLPELGEAIGKVLGLAPQYSVPLLVKGLLLAVAGGIDGIVGELEAVLDYELDLIAATTAAAQPGNIVLQAIVDCESVNFDLQLRNLNESAAPLNRLIGQLKALAELAQLPIEIPTIGDFGQNAAAALDPLRTTAGALRSLADAIPG